MKKIASIPFIEIEGIPSILKDFLKKQGEIFSRKDVQERIKVKKQSYTSVDRKILHEVVTEQMKGLSLSNLQRQNLEFLAKHNTFTITTGHQLNLFSGAVFFVYKILQTIKIADYLSREFPEYTFLPVFWLATEDHDFEEIQSFSTETKRYTLDAKNGTAVGRIVIEDTAFIQEFRQDFKDFPQGQALINLMEECYQVGKTLAEATRKFVQALFRDYGLLIIDGDDVRLKKMMTGIFERELKDQILYTSTQQEVQKLTQQYGKVQVNPREINLFYLDEERNRIVKEKNGNYTVLNTEKTFSWEEMMEELYSHPEKFSPNAVMRPCYQEKVLPNIAYIGGNAEVAYWLELKDFFKAADIPFPMLIPRHSMLWLTEKQVKKMEKWEVAPSEIIQSEQALLKPRFLKNESLERILEQGKNALCQSFKALKENALQTDVTFLNLVVAEEQRQMKSFTRMKKRLHRAEKRKNADKVEQFHRWYESLHPNGIWQERVYNFSVFFSIYGIQWLSTCYDTLEIDVPKLYIMKI